ncbi:MAG: hypothetical protein J6T89_03565, partial [Bacteroidales bacterium]|nr:hypothetical protein [Bacteroidales bacterium]
RDSCLYRVPLPQVSPFFPHLLHWLGARNRALSANIRQTKCIFPVFSYFVCIILTDKEHCLDVCCLATPSIVCKFSTDNRRFCGIIVDCLLFVSRQSTLGEIQRTDETGSSLDRRLDKTFGQTFG